MAFILSALRKVKCKNKYSEFIYYLTIDCLKGLVHDNAHV